MVLKWQCSRKEVSKMEEASTWPLGTEFIMMLQKRILGHIETEQRKDRNVVYNLDMGVGTSDIRCNECFNIGVFMVKRYIESWAQIYLKKSAPLCSYTWYV
jgi:hypothetical protein